MNQSFNVVILIFYILLSLVWVSTTYNQNACIHITLYIRRVYCVRLVFIVFGSIFYRQQVQGIDANARRAFMSFSAIACVCERHSLLDNKNRKP
jgi:hypothetical protein